MDKAIEKLIEAVQQASPTLWAAAQAKVQADIAVAHIWFWAALIGMAIGLALCVLAGCGPGYDSGILVIPGSIMLVGGALAAICAYTSWVAYAAAPQWYAIRALAELSPVK